MKKTLVTMMAAAAVVATSYGQGTVVFQNAPTSLIQLEGTTATAAAGAKASLWSAPAGTTDPLLFTLVGNTVNVGVPLAGRFSGGTYTVPTATPGGEATLLVRAYVGTDWASALTRGESSIFTTPTGNPNTIPAGTPTTISGLYGPINMTIVPEPTSMALAGLGAASLLLFRRRK
jgi:hypothetical protein